VAFLAPNSPASQVPAFASSTGGSADELAELLERMEVQGALESLGARWAAERGISADQVRSVRERLREMDRLLPRANVSFTGLMQFVRLDSLFHRSVLELAHCPTLSRYIEEEPATIFTIPEVTRVMLSDPERLSALLVIEQDQHHRIIEAVESGMGARAESLVREHSRLARRHLIGLI
jgi:GntR family transcriptional regulator, vanillate catabolism transcriptional regulator